MHKPVNAELFECSRTITVRTYKWIKNERVETGRKQYKSIMTMDVDSIIQELATKAARSKGKRAKVLHGKIRVDVTEV